MDESHLEAEQSLTRRLVDQVGPGAGELGERGAEVAHLEGNVMHSRAALGQEPTDGRIDAEWFQ